MTKKIILILAAVLTTLGLQAQQTVKIYKNGQLYKIYNNTPTNRYSVVFDTYVKIGDTKWATMNVGATTVADSPETAYGDYFAWGEVETYYASLDAVQRKEENGDIITEDVITWKTNANNTHIKGEKSGYDKDNYWGDNWNEKDDWNPQPRNTDGNLLPDYDVAYTTMDGQWRIPTQEDYRALYEACGATGDKCTPKEVTGSTISTRGIYYVEANSTIDGTHYGVGGFLFVADDTDTNCRIFFPAASYIQSDLCDKRHYCGYYWTATYDSNNLSQAHSVTMSYELDNEYIGINEAQARYIGYTIRPIMK